MKLHELKIKDNYYWDVFHGYKSFELRKNDRDYQVGDLIHFVDVNGNDFLNEPFNLFVITYVLKYVSEYGLDEDYCILSIQKYSNELLKRLKLL